MSDFFDNLKHKSWKRQDDTVIADNESTTLENSWWISCCIAWHIVVSWGFFA